MPRSPDTALRAAQTLAQKNNDAEAVYRAYLRRRPLSNAKASSRRRRKTRRQNTTDAFAWAAAERNARPVRAIGFFLHQ